MSEETTAAFAMCGRGHDKMVETPEDDTKMRPARIPTKYSLARLYEFCYEVQVLGLYRSGCAEVFCTEVSYSPLRPFIHH